MQLATIEFARNVAHFHGANSTEFDPETPYPVVALMDAQRKMTQMGGTMRLGSYECTICADSHLYHAYGCNCIHERHRHRYEFNSAFGDILQSAGLRISGTHSGSLVEAIELQEHPWFVGVQFHPEFKSKPHVPHPLFSAFIHASRHRS
jgi:CTP synthase